MFLNYIKDFSVKKILKNSLHNVKSSSLSTSIQTVGLLIDASYFSKKEALIKELIANGISANNIKVIVYKDKFKKSDARTHTAFGAKHLNWKGEITDPQVNDFVNEKFDLLISYYDVEKAILMVVTHNSKAQFKVGFSSIDKRLNHLMINTNTENFKVFTHELFRYLKILNKL
ncbi:DUF6913 domain-containing protein [Flavobacterium gawalongense]|uniref:Uncharacterized protein n=1 Tax=Flavobacterium gawalongense TaxID=2594432 RepID=A0A553BRZ4_9FLAO|nr:hypothetical protein [Flavobacterium gawalongense]TRX03125.1 hypothetical protein FNW33_04640 [Flavobacterium gawalongense]TRX09787.1 hypothetical protein FNW12_01330 [Flavobacterium gawalongense]TRX11013.1 hypothetical protein FNW11_06450 [Flavobacterium gawalongense]TRX12024.1 hypothetical protein FNW10_05925 [Flavobacterium gawalongense]TRX29870.1 hypothetical protein FNW38_06020 [Flavobacterium gawalongense]